MVEPLSALLMIICSFTFSLWVVCFCWVCVVELWYSILFALYAELCLLRLIVPFSMSSLSVCLGLGMKVRPFVRTLISVLVRL